MRQPFATLMISCAVAATLQAAQTFRFLEPCAVSYELDADSNARAAAPATVGAGASEWLGVRRADGRAGKLEMGRRVVVAVEPSVDLAKVGEGRPLKFVREFAPGIGIWEAADPVAAAEQAADLATVGGVVAAHPVMRRRWDFIDVEPAASAAGGTP